jgi:hypothetical protein
MCSSGWSVLGVVLFLLVLGQAHTAIAIGSETAGETISTSEKDRSSGDRLLVVFIVCGSRGVWRCRRLAATIVGSARQGLDR